MANQPTITKTPVGGPALNVPAPLAPFKPQGGISLPAGAHTKSLADSAAVAKALQDSAPTFGNVLASIGDGVASSQAALDRGVIDTVNALNKTKITVVTDVIQRLGDDGLPLPPDPEKDLIKKEVSVINFVTPTVHEWKHVAVSMDLSIGSIDDQQGVTFNQHQHSSGWDSTGLFWGFIGWTDVHDNDATTDVTHNAEQEVAWTQGQVRVDALLAPRETSKFPVPADIAIGPQIYLTQGALKETKTGDVVTQRSVDVIIEVRRADGSVNPNKPIVLDAGPLVPSFNSTLPWKGSDTNDQGQCLVTLTRNLSPIFGGQARETTITVNLNAVSRTLTVTL